ncbi:UvrD-helicase domain-containing protein [Flavobacterium terrae]|uniref:DNA 3'-5' helicase n=1 Tax=Flavobacterium terrae TaxID=415425 RepID=A0A1M6B7N9_9FLAO|nr:UvrD-helicase domain-containing protein [Flavobacterium terrae]SHI44742.1 ATP-dependent exoDNAse (exonuclease V) beta subunit (contains helicase and exonuclease domains) [Flavobacterium terrae]
MVKPAFSIYNASAGSGKTYTLVKEYLKIILTSPRDDAYKNILAITFTNKAVQEMKSRIVDSLYDFTKDQPSIKALGLMQDLSGETGLNLIEITKKARSIIKNIIHNYAAFDISTIDKFTHKVIRSFALDLNLPITFDVSLDTENLLQEAVDSIIAEAGNDEVLTKLLVDFTMEKTDDDKSWDVSGEIFNAGKLVLNENYRNEVVSLQEKTIPDFIKLKLKLNDLCKQLIEDTKQMASSVLGLIDQKGIDLKSFSGGYFPKHLQGISEGIFNPNNKTYHEFEDVKINKSARDKEIIEARIPELLNQLKEIYTKLEKKAFYEAFLKNITPLSLLNTINNKLKVIQEEQNILSIAEFNKLIYDQIKKQPAPFIYERLGERYKHFFIDEFQDTSQMQWENLIPLIDNALSSEDLQGVRGSLMLVGDPKQSIYRWRGGKAEQLIDLTHSENPFSNKEKKVFNLERNYRSFDEVINFNNDFFKFLSHKFDNEDYKKLYLENSFQLSNDKKGGLVNISFLPLIESSNDIEDEDDLTTEDLYLQKTLRLIHDVQQKGFSLNEIVLLVRSNKHGILLANYLTENNIEVISSESLLIQSSFEVQYLLNALRYINDPKDKESLAQVLYYFSKSRVKSISSHDFIVKGISFEKQENLQTWLSSFGIEIDFKSIKKKSLFELVETLVHKGVLIENNNAYVQFFLDIVLERDVKYQLSIGDFLDFWNKSGSKFSVPSNENSDAIRIMTIHKSKGLEFPVVIFPFADENYSSNKGEKIWIDSNEDTDIDKFLVDKSSSVLRYGEKAVEIYNQKEQEKLLDNVNVLYVALTRAEEQLYIVSSMKERNSKGVLPNNLASYFIEFLEFTNEFKAEQLEYVFGSSERVSLPKTKQETQEFIKNNISVLKPESIKIAQREALMWGTHQQEAIEFGNVMHKVLSFIETKKDVDIAITKALESGLISEDQKELVSNSLLQIVNHDELYEFFLEGNKVLNEVSILRNNASTIIPDRIVFNDNKAYLLDYKTGEHNLKYVSQINEYEKVLIEMGYQVDKKALVYIGEKIEVVHL